MNVRRAIPATVFAAAIALLTAGSEAATHAGTGSAPSGDQVLARAVAAPGLRSYAVPVQFAVHLRKPIGIRARADGSAYFRAPAQSALVITHATGLVGRFFRGAYKLDMVPQAWPYTYHVVSQARTVVAGVRVLQLQALPRAAAPDIARVILTLNLPQRQPISAEWRYKNGSSIRLSYINGRTGAYTLPLHATVAVDMPLDKLDAEATYGAYVFNAPVPDDVFSSAR